MSNYTPHPDYEALPEILKKAITEEEFTWMGNEGRQRIEDDYFYPEPEDYVD